ncbi:MAG: hypothetical protein R3B54_16015 [Bdellovibrionota bacterium]
MNASFIRLKPKVKLVVINMGLIEFIDDDHEGSFVTGHELEHGWSNLQDVVDGRDPSDLVTRMLQRAVENEVDLKSVFKRMIPAGADPYASERFIRKLRIHFPSNGFSETHTATSSREDTLALANTAARRELGREELDLDKIPELPTKVVETAKDSKIFEGDFERILVDAIAADFSELNQEVAEYFLHQNEKEREAYEQRTGNRADWVHRPEPPAAFAEKHWGEIVGPQLPGKVSQENYFKLREAHAKAIAEAYLAAWKAYLAKYPGEPERREFPRLMKMLIPPDLSRQVEYEKEAVESANEYYQTTLGYRTNGETDPESAEHYIKEAKQRLDEAEQKLLIATKNKEIWERYVGNFREARATLMASFPQLCSNHLCTSRDFAWMVGTSQESKIWETAGVYADTFDSTPDQWQDEEKLWQTLYTLDKAKATDNWNRFLKHFVDELAEKKSYYGGDILNTVAGVRKRCGNFAAYPEYEAAIATTLAPAVRDYLNRTLAHLLTGKDDEDDEPTKPEYAIGQLRMNIETLVKLSARAAELHRLGLLAKADYDAFKSKHFDSVRAYVVRAARELPAPYNFQDFDDKYLVAAAILVFPEEEWVGHLTTVGLKGTSSEMGHLISTLVEKSLLCEPNKEYVSYMFHASGIRNFYRLIRITDPKTADERERFFRTAYAMRSKLGWHRPLEPNLPIVDPDMSLWIGYFDWLVANHPEERELIRSLFSQKKLEKSYSYPADLSEEETKKIQAAYEKFFSDVDKINQAELAKRVTAYIDSDVEKKYAETGSIEETITYAVKQYDTRVLMRFEGFCDLFDRPLRPRVLRPVPKPSVKTNRSSPPASSWTWRSQNPRERT